jgi:hypothetical protein
VSRRPNDSSQHRFARREWLRIGGLGCLGLHLGQLVEAAPVKPVAQRGADFGRARRCILLFLSGGPPQHETFDPKPSAPEEIRGPFQPIATRVPGLQVCELLPQIASIADRLTVIRSMSTRISAHAASGYWMLTGYPHPAGAIELPAAPSDWPSIGATVGALGENGHATMSAVTLPERIVNNPGTAWPGQNGGFMGAGWDPFLLTCDPSQPKFRIDALSLPDEVSLSRLTSRRALLGRIDQVRSAVDRTEVLEGYSLASRQAFEMLTGSATRAAFDLDQEPATLRDRYGRHKFGQSVLLARRLIESGVRLVQVNYPREPGDLSIGSPLWDTHSDHVSRVKSVLCPTFDTAFSSLILDLETRGLLEETLVVVMGEFGRTPKFNVRGGRDHWGNCFSIALAGAGLPRGFVLGASDSLGAMPATRPVRPDELAATIFHLLGIDPASEFHDRQQRPRRICAAEPIAELIG